MSDDADVREIAMSLAGVVEAEKQALLRGEPDLFFTAPGYDHAPVVMVRLVNVDRMRLEELICDAWQMRLDLGS